MVLRSPKFLARLHYGFEKVHPFIDGNGRTRRLLLVRRKSRLTGSIGDPTQTWSDANRVRIR
jgi:fido (protein-threonine AMPylation protein)